jgi:hypothetical protein
MPTLNKGFDKNFSAYRHAPSRWSGFLFKNEMGQEEKGERIDAFQKWMTETDISTTRITLIDDADAFASRIDQWSIHMVSFIALRNIQEN